MYDKCYFCLDQLPKLKKESTASFFVNFGGAGVQKSRPTLLYYIRRNTTQVEEDAWGLNLILSTKKQKMFQNWRNYHSKFTWAERIAALNKNEAE